MHIGYHDSRSPVSCITPVIVLQATTNLAPRMIDSMNTVPVGKQYQRWHLVVSHYAIVAFCGRSEDVKLRMFQEVLQNADPSKVLRLL